MKKREYLTKKILKGLLLVGMIYIACASPYFSYRFSQIIKRELMKKLLKKKKIDKRFDNVFYHLKRKGYLIIKKRRKQIYISLTEKGRKRAGKYLIDDLKIEKPKFWDKKWRILVFDIPNLTKIKREALRGKLKELKFFQLQKSVWVYPFPCQKEINLLREFFGLDQKELKLITGEIEKDEFLKKFFKI